MKASRAWIRFLCALLCLAVLMPCVSAAAETTKVAVYLLRLRATASDKGTVLDAFPRGTVVTILKKGSPWTKVRVHGKVGYMRTDMLAYGRYGGSTSGSGNSSSSSSSGKSGGNVTSGSTRYVAKGVRLNLREEANVFSDIIASFRGGTKVTVIKAGKYWSYVEVGGLVGYMGSEYLVTEKE